MSATTPATPAAALAADLLGREDESLVRLVGRRPDLAAPPPSSILALAARAGTRASVERVLATLDALGLALGEALVALDRPSRAPLGPEEIGHAVGLPTDVVAPGLTELTELALIVDGRPVPALRDALGPHPAGLGPWADDLTEGAGATDADRPELVTDAAEVRRLLDGAPPEARRLLEAMLWGRPDGTATGPHLPAGATWLVEHGLLALTGPHRVTLPREVALAVREGRTSRTAPRPPTPASEERDAATVDAEGAGAATEVVRQVAALLDLWEASPAPTLRSGGVGVREVRRVSRHLGLAETRVALLAEVAAAAGLLWRSEDEAAVWAPSTESLAWREDTGAARWVTLVDAWLGSSRAPWLVGARDAGGALLPVLGPGLDSPWAVRLRTESFDVLAAHAGAAVGAQDVAAVLRFRHPRLPERDADVAAVLDELDALGVTGAGALTSAARALVAEGPLAAEAALERAMPQPVDRLIVQGDLTAVVPGTPTPPLAALLRECTEVESRGSALTVRFTDAALARALDAGRDPEELLEDLRAASLTPLPQPLEYLVRDVARRHGRVRLGAAGTYLRTETREELEVLLGRPELAALELRALADTVLVSPENPAVVAEALRAAGQSPTVEGPDGRPVREAPTASSAAPRRGRRGERRATSPGRSDTGVRAGRGIAGRTAAPDAAASEAERARALAIVRRARAAEEAGRGTDGVRRSVGVPDTPPVEGPSPVQDPLLALEVLRAAAGARDEVDVALVGRGGELQRRRVVPVSVDAGRVRLRDAARDVELTVSVARIASATPAP